MVRLPVRANFVSLRAAWLRVQMRAGMTLRGSAEMRMIMRYKSKGYTVFTVFNYIFLSLVGFACLYPLYYVVIASFSDPVKLISHDGMLLLPQIGRAHV